MASREAIMPNKKRRRKRSVNVRNLLIVIIGAAVLLGIAVFAISCIFAPKEPEKPAVETIDPAEAEAAEQQEESAPQESPESTSNETRVSLFLSGDGLLHESVYEDAANADGSFDFAKQMDRITAVAEKYDLQFYNQETILGGTELGLTGYPVFNSPQEFGSYMVSKGFNLVSTANNHCLDMGFTGVTNSRNFWNAQSGVLMQGTNTSQEEYDEIAVTEVNGMKIAFLAYCENTNGIAPDYNWEVNYFPGYEEEMLAKVAKADAECDAVIVSMHWGTEYSFDVNETQKSLAKRLVDAGADVIVGNHVHVIEPFEWIDGTPVFYAMGNLISSQIDVENRIGMMAGMDLVKTVNADGTSEVKVENLRADLHYTYLEGEYPELRTNIRVYPFAEMDDSILEGYQSTYEEFKQIITSMDQNIQIGGV